MRGKERYENMWRMVREGQEVKVTGEKKVK